MKTDSVLPLDDSIELAVQQRLRRWEHLIIGALVALGVLNVSAGYLYLGKVKEQAVADAKQTAVNIATNTVSELAADALDTANRHRERIEALAEKVGEVSSGVSALEIVRYELESLSQARSEIEELRQVHALLAQNTKNLEALAGYLAENPQFHDAVVCAALRTGNASSASINVQCGGEL